MRKITILIIIFLSLGSTVYGADLYFDFPEEVQVDNQFEVDIKLDTGGLLVNSVDLIIDYPESSLEFNGYREGGGVINMWLESPQNSSGKIKLSGVIPGGVEGTYDPYKSTLEPLLLTKLLFKPRNAGNGEFVFDYSNILLNDGNGSELSHNKENRFITINSRDDFNAPEDNPKDNTPPEPFRISLVKSNYFSKTPYMLVFDTVDLSSGVKKYEMYIKKHWMTVSSPATVRSPLFSREIKIRAVDYNDNVQESSIIIDGRLSGLHLVLVVFGVGLFALCVFMCYNRIFRK